MRRTHYPVSDQLLIPQHTWLAKTVSTSCLLWEQINWIGCHWNAPWKHPHQLLNPVSSFGPTCCGMYCPWASKINYTRWVRIQAEASHVGCYLRSPLESLLDQSNHFCPGQFSTREWVKLSFKMIKMMINNFHGKYTFYVTYILEF